MKGGAKFRVGVDPRLLFGGPVEELVAHLVRPEDERVAQVKLDFGGLAARLRDPAALDERGHVGQQLAVRGRLITTSLYRKPSHRPPALGEQEINQLC